MIATLHYAPKVTKTRGTYVCRRRRTMFAGLLTGRKRRHGQSLRGSSHSESEIVGRPGTGSDRGLVLR